MNTMLIPSNTPEAESMFELLVGCYVRIRSSACPTARCASKIDVR
jgi:hypothetical protein